MELILNNLRKTYGTVQALKGLVIPLSQAYMEYWGLTEQVSLR